MEPANHVAMNTLAARYAQAVDRRDTPALTSLFTPDATFVLPPELNGTGAPSELHGKTVVAQSVIEEVSHLAATRHVVDQQILELDSAHIAHGETYCTAHHIYSRATGYRDNRVAIRYQDSFTQADGVWLFSRRELVVDFSEDVPVTLRP